MHSSSKIRWGFAVLLAGSILLAGCAQKETDVGPEHPALPGAPGAANTTGASVGAPATSPGSAPAPAAGKITVNNKTVVTGTTPTPSPGTPTPAAALGSSAAGSGGKSSTPGPAATHTGPDGGARPDWHGGRRGPNGTGWQGPAGGAPGPDMFAAYKAKYPGTFALSQAVRSVRTLERSEDVPLTGDQADQLSDVLTPLLTLPQLSQTDAEKIAKAAAATLTPAQQTEIEQMRQQRGGWGGPRSGGGWQGRGGGTGAPGGNTGGWHGRADGAGKLAGPGPGSNGSTTAGGGPGGWHGGGPGGGMGGGPGGWHGGGPGGGPGGRMGGGMDMSAPLNFNPYLDGRQHDMLVRLLGELKP